MEGASNSRYIYPHTPPRKIHVHTYGVSDREGQRFSTGQVYNERELQYDPRPLLPKAPVDSAPAPAAAAMPSRPGMSKATHTKRLEIPLIMAGSEPMEPAESRGIESDSEMSEELDAASSHHQKRDRDLQMPDDSYFHRSRRDTSKSGQRRRKKASVHELLEEVNRPTEAEVERKGQLIEREFGLWRHHLMHSSNLLIYGYGSKRSTLESFATSHCTDGPIVVVKGFLPTVTPKKILATVAYALQHGVHGTNGVVREKTRHFKGMVEQRRFIAESLAADRVDAEIAVGDERAGTSSILTPIWAPGDQVLGQTFDNNIYPATIVSVQYDEEGGGDVGGPGGFSYIVEWEDGDTRNLELSPRDVFPPQRNTRSSKKSKQKDALDRQQRLQLWSRYCGSNAVPDGAPPLPNGAVGPSDMVLCAEDAAHSSAAEPLNTVEGSGEVTARRSSRLQTHAAEKLPQRRIYLLVHNIDGPGLAKIAMQEVLCFLADLPGVHVVASVDNIHAPLLWNWSQACTYARFNWAWCEATTYLPYEMERLHLSNDQHSAASQAGRVRGAAIVLSSLPQKTRGVFSLLAAKQSVDESFSGLAFHTFFKEARFQFLSSTEDNFRTLLHELQDHKIIELSKSGGVDSYRINFNAEQIAKILRNMTESDGVGAPSDEESADEAERQPARAAASCISESVTDECYVMKLAASSYTGHGIESRAKKAFEYCAALTKKTMDEAVGKGNDDLFESISQFFSLNWKRRELPSALLLTGLNVADHDYSFAQLQHALRRSLAQPGAVGGKPSVVRVSSSDASSLSGSAGQRLDCLMSHIIGGLMRDAGTLHVQSVPSTLLLQRWYNDFTAATRPSHLVVLIQDVESIRFDIVQDMVRLLSAAKTRSLHEEDENNFFLPVYVVLGFATTTDAVSSVLTHRERALISTQHFSLQPARRTLNALLDSLLDGRDWSTDARDADLEAEGPAELSEINEDGELNENQIEEMNVSEDGEQGVPVDGALGAAEDGGVSPTAASTNHALEGTGIDPVAFRERIQAFLGDSAKCAEPVWPVAVSLPQFSETAMGQLVDNAFYCNFEIDSFRKTIQFGITHHFFSQPLSHLCRYIGGGCSFSAPPDLSDGDLSNIRGLRSVSQYIQDSAEAPAEPVAREWGPTTIVPDLSTDEGLREQTATW